MTTTNNVGLYDYAVPCIGVRGELYFIKIKAVSPEAATALVVRFNEFTEGGITAAKAVGELELRNLAEEAFFGRALYRVPHDVDPSKDSTPALHKYIYPPSEGV